MTRPLDLVIQQARERERLDPTALVSVFDRQGFYCHVSDMHQRVLGFEPHELLGTHWTEMIDEPDLKHAHVLRTMAELQAGQPIAMNFKVKTKSGRVVKIKGTVTFLRFEDDNFLLTTSSALVIS
jgi:PAS domain S-box-containing protein